jgi:integrase
MAQDRSFAIYNRQDRTSESGKTTKQYVLVFTPGQRGKLPESSLIPPFYIRYQSGGKQWVRLEARSIEDAKIESQQARDVQNAVAKGISVIGLPQENSERLGSKIAAYLAEVEANKSIGTWRAYQRSLELFQQSCHRLNLSDVRREDLLAFKTFLKKQKDIGERSQYNNFLNTMIFFAWAKHKVDIKKNDWPSKPERDPEEYHADEIEKLLKAANKDERLLLNAFLNSGLRDGEMAHLTFGDIDTRNSLWSVRPKGGHNLKTKHAPRVVPVGEWLRKKIMEKKTAEGKHDSDLIFPSPRGGGVDEHLIRVVKRVADRAGLKDIRVDNHKFRSTAITIWLRSGRTVPEVMAYVGHRDPSTILRYAAKVNLAREENRRKVTAPFDQFAKMGD